MKYSLTFSESTGEFGVGGSTAGSKGFSLASRMASTSRSDAASSCSLELKLELASYVMVMSTYLDSSMHNVGVDSLDSTFTFAASVTGEPIQLNQEGPRPIPYLLNAAIDQVF